MKIRTRILTEQQIRALPLHNLKRYRHAVLAQRKKLYWSLVTDVCCEVCNTILASREPTEEEVKMIKTLDWLAARCHEQYKMKK